MKNILTIICIIFIVGFANSAFSYTITGGYYAYCAGGGEVDRQSDNTTHTETFLQGSGASYGTLESVAQARYFANLSRIPANIYSM